MKKFDYVILGGGCAGLSLAYHLEISKKLNSKSLVIIESRETYTRDKVWSFFKLFPHHFEDCIMKSWPSFLIQTKQKEHLFNCENFPYQSIDSLKFYQKILTLLKKNKNITFCKDLSNIDTSNSLIFNSFYPKKKFNHGFWQHFKGIEIETPEPMFNTKAFTMMDFYSSQKTYTHFFYVLPFSHHRALIETTWFLLRIMHLKTIILNFKTTYILNLELATTILTIKKPDLSLYFMNM